MAENPDRKPGSASANTTSGTMQSQSQAWKLT